MLQVRLCLDEWRLGTRQTIEFKAATYEPVYDLHLAALKSLQDADPTFVKQLGTELWEDCRSVHSLRFSSGLVILTLWISLVSAGLEKNLLATAGVSLTQDQIDATLKYAEARRQRRALPDQASESESDEA